MPKVPYNPVPEVTPYKHGTPMFNISTPPAAFGVETAKALEALGRQGEASGTELFNAGMALKKLENETITTAAKAKYSLGAGQKNEQFMSQEGLNAGPDQLAAHQSGLEAYRQSIRDSLPNDATKRDFDAESLGFQNRLIISSSGHSARQMIAANKQAKTSFEDAIIEEGHKDPLDFEGDPFRMKKLEQSVRESGALQGYKPEKIEENVKEAQSKYVLAKAKGLMKDQPILAQKFVIANEKYLYRDDLERAHGLVQNEINRSGTRNVINETYDPKKSEKENREAAKAKGEEYGLRPEAMDMVDKGVVAKWRLDKQTKSIDTQEAKQTIAEGMSGRATGKGPVKDLDELLAIPGMREAYENLPPADKNQVPGQILRMFTSETKMRNQRNFETLKGMMNDPESIPRFLAEDATKWDLSGPEIRQIQSFQREIRKNSEGDPLVNRALGIKDVQAIMAGLNLNKKTEENAKKYWQFVGQFQDALQYQTQGGKKILSTQDMVDTAKKLTHDFGEKVSAWKFWEKGPRPWWEVARDIPEEDIEKKRREIMDSDPNANPTAEEVTRGIAFDYMKELFKEKSK